MGKVIDIVGLKYGKLLVVKHLYKNFWECLCDCGKASVQRTGDLKMLKSKSCGCTRYDTLKHRITSHSMTGTRIYRIWRGVISRCNFKTATSYDIYGGRGIKVCHEWEKDFMSFYRWATTNGYDKTLTIERIDVNGHYEPNNCKWITKGEQALNKRVRKVYPMRNNKGQFVPTLVKPR